MQLKILFWNLKARPDLAAQLAFMAAVEGADVVVVCEADAMSAPAIEAALTGSTGRPFHHSPAPVIGKTLVFFGLPPGTFHPIRSTSMGRLTLHRMHHETPEILLASVHLRDQRSAGEEQRFYSASEVAQEIRREEHERGHTRTLVIGDFNLNPYDTGMTAAQTFNAVLCRRIANSQNGRMVQGTEFPFFYNPTWNLLGDRRHLAPGTYYHGSGDGTGPYWHILDQAIVRPALVRNELPKVKILSNFREICTNRGTPSATKASDHFPILVNIEV